MHDEGYIKFKANWIKKKALPDQRVEGIRHWRNLLFKEGLIGVYPDGIGFGNISQRYFSNQFIISGSATGHLPELQAEHFSLVTHFDIDQNKVTCEGPIIASSESMSHAVIYQECPEVNAVIHIHHLGWWEKWKDRLPTTAESATYGTPEMAKAIIGLLRESDLRHREKIFIMAGHREGIIAFGDQLPTVVASLLELKNR